MVFAANRDAETNVETCERNIMSFIFQDSEKRKKTIASIVFTKHKKADTHLGICFFYLRWRGIRTHLNADIRWTSACRRSRRRQHIN